MCLTLCLHGSIRGAPKYFAEKTELGLERRKSAVGLAQESRLSERGEQSLTTGDSGESGGPVSLFGFKSEK